MIAEPPTHEEIDAAIGAALLDLEPDKDFYEEASLLSQADLAAALDRTEKRLDELRAELRRRNVSPEYVETQRRLDASTSQMLADERDPDEIMAADLDEPLCIIGQGEYAREYRG